MKRIIHAMVLVTLVSFFQWGNAENLLPIGLAENAVLKRDIAKDAVLTYDDVELPSDSLTVALRRQQDEMFPVSN